MRRISLAALVGTLAGLSATPVAAEVSHSVTNDVVVTSFDGTPIVGHLFVPSDAEPNGHEVILMTHGWGGTGQAGIGGFLQRLLDQGYVVFTWDQRGFGCSGGTVEIDHNLTEGRDVSSIIDWLVANVPQVRRDASDDPVVGMYGGSYAGGIQTAAASVDERIDAIVPVISWADLRYAMFGNGVPNVGWSLLLSAAGAASATSAGLDPACPAGIQAGTLSVAIVQALAEGTALSQPSEASQQYFAERSLNWYSSRERETPRVVDIPTLVIQGSTDTLFDLTDGADIFHHVQSMGAPAEFIAFCGGHVACPGSYAAPEIADGDYTSAAALDWFARWLRGDTAVDTGAVVEYRTNAGVWRDADRFDEEMDGVLVASGAADGLPALPVIDTDLSLTNALPGDASLPFSQYTEVAEACGGPVEMVGIPRVSGTIELTGVESHLFFRLVHREANEVLNLQESAIRLTSSGEFDLRMSGVAYTLPEGHHLDLEVSTSSAMHRPTTTPSVSNVDWDLRIPLVAGSLDTVCGAEVIPSAQGPGVDPVIPPGQPDDGSSGEMPATGGGLALVAVLAIAVAAGGLRRRGSARAAPPT